MCGKIVIRKELMVNSLKKILKLSLVILIISAFTLSISSTAQQADGLYYSNKLVKNMVFTWNVTISEDYYEEIPEGANFTVQLKDDLYPGPLSEEDLEKVYASVKVDGNKYTGEGFPLFWHVNRTETGNTTTIREEFEGEPTLFQVVNGLIGFVVNFTVTDDPYELYVEMEIDPTDGITKRYYESFNDTDANVTSELELIFLGNILGSPISTMWSLLGIFSIAALVLIVRRKRNKKV